MSAGKLATTTFLFVWQMLQRALPSFVKNTLALRVVVYAVVVGAVFNATTEKRMCV